MKYEAYVKPELEELELQLEGSFLLSKSKEEGFEPGGEVTDPEDWD